MSKNYTLTKTNTVPTKSTMSQAHTLKKTNTAPTKSTMSKNSALKKHKHVTHEGQNEQERLEEDKHGTQTENSEHEERLEEDGQQGHQHGKHKGGEEGPLNILAKEDGLSEALRTATREERIHQEHGQLSDPDVARDTADLKNRGNHQHDTLQARRPARLSERRGSQSTTMAEIAESIADARWARGR